MIMQALWFFTTALFYSEEEQDKRIALQTHKFGLLPRSQFSSFKVSGMGKRSALSFLLCKA